MPLYDKLYELFEETEATGEFAPSSATLSERKVSEEDFTVNDPCEDEEDLSEADGDRISKTDRWLFDVTPPVRKRRRSAGSSGNRSRKKSVGIALSESIDRLVAARNGPCETWSMKATSLFFEEMAATMSEDEACLALEVLEDHSKAGMFCKMPNNIIRKRWLERQMEKLA